jgi:NAD(P)-dependent dehydrogenase (short-subunit alcohol dehydrogenase family)
LGVPSLQAKIVAVTGGGRGLGQALVQALGRQGAAVALSYRESRDGALEGAESLRRLGLPVFVARADATVPGEMARFVASAAEALGGLDGLVNNVGVFRKSGDAIEAELSEAFDVNCTSAITASLAAAPHIRRRGGGSIVNVASLGGLRPWPSHLPYCVSKAALVMATQCLAVALAPEIRVNAVAPGILDPPGAAEAIRGRIPLRRFGSHAEAVECVLFLLGGGTYVTGEVVRLDVGRALV